MTRRVFIRATPLSALLVLLLMESLALGHALLLHAEPRVGATVSASPQCVRLEFDSALQPGTSSLKVEDYKGKRADKGDPRVDSKHATCLEVSVPALAPGIYRVFWTAVALDGHCTRGDYTFTVAEPR